MPVSKLRFFGFFLALAAAFLQAPQLFASDFSHGISFFGDLKYEKNFTHFDYVNPAAPKQGAVRFGVEGGFNNLNQFLLKGISASGLTYLYDSLTEGSDDEISARYGLVAKGVRLAADASAIEFLLNENAAFHDGVKITADDVVFTFNALLKDGHPSYKMAFREVAAVKKIDTHLVKFSFRKSGNRKLALLIASPLMKNIRKQWQTFSTVTDS